DSPFSARGQRISTTEKVDRGDDRKSKSKRGSNGEPWKEQARKEVEDVESHHFQDEPSELQAP
ncbi:unnamed protein product, partial [Amoebophrya sp. A25]